MIVIYGLSALEYHATAPILRLAVIPEELASTPPPMGCGLEKRLLRQRKNARDVARHLCGRLLGELKGLSLPVRVLTDEVSATAKTALFHASRMRDDLPREDLINLGGGLYVTTIERTLLDCACRLSPVQLMVKLFEACGTYAVPPADPRVRCAVNMLLASGEITPEHPSGERPRIFEFYDAKGRRVLPYEAQADSLPWELCFDTRGRPTRLWRRPPLTSKGRIARYIDGVGHTRGVAPLRHVLGNVIDGSASPLETEVLLMLCGSKWIGGEGWEEPWVNRRLDFPLNIRALSGQGYAIPDQMWLDRGIIFECQGKAFHADEQGFEVRNGRRAGLEALGFEVREITDAQVRNLEIWDAMLEGFSRALDMPLRKRTPAFLRRRDELRGELFGMK